MEKMNHKRLDRSCEVPRSMLEAVAEVCLPRIHLNFFNLLLFASCTDTFSKWCKITRGIKRSAQ
jgi:hypothetical protein